MIGEEHTRTPVSPPPSHVPVSGGEEKQGGEPKKGACIAKYDASSDIFQLTFRIGSVIGEGSEVCFPHKIRL
jgi:hypothetical protein